MRWFYPILWTVLTLVCSFLLPRIASESYLRVPYTEYYLDHEGHQTIESIRQQPFLSSEKKTIPPAAKTIWLRIAVPEKLQSWDQDAILFTGSNEAALSMEGFLTHDESIDYRGYCNIQLNSVKCPTSTLQYAFPVGKSEYKNRVYYLKIVPGASGINNEFYFMKQSYFNKVTLFLVHFIGLATGIFLVVALLAFIFFSSLKEPSFLIYGLFYLNHLAAVTINRGIWDAYRPVDIVFTGANLLFPVLILTIFFDLLFIRAFFEISKRHPRLNTIYMLGLISIIIVFFLGLFPETQVIAWRILVPAIFCTMFLTGVSLIYFILKKRLWAEQIATAWGVAIVCNLIWAGYRAGVIEGFWFFGYYAIFGRALEGLILNTVIFQKLQKLTLKVGFAQAQNEESKVIKTLLRTLSHDLSNTTQLVKSTAEVLKENTSDLNTIQNIDRILYAAQEQTGIIENAKNSFLLRGKHVLNLIPVNLKKSINEAIDLYQPEIKRKNLLFVVNVEDHLNVIAEKTSLTHQVLSNLISNACKFSHDGKTIYITASFQDPSTVELKIKDEGVGIPHQLLDRIFDDEMDVRQVGTNGETGTGSGLLIARDFMAVYGGTLQVASETDKGAEVTLRLKSFK